MESKSGIILGGNSSTQEETEATETLVEYAGDAMTVTVLEDGDQDQDVDAEEDEDEDGESIAIEKLPLQFQKVSLIII